MSRGPALLAWSILAGLLVLLAGPATSGPATGATIEPGATGFAVKRPVMASACAHVCPWGELGDFVKEALAPFGYDVVLCRNCNRDAGPRVVARAARPPPLAPADLQVGTIERVDASVDFGVTESGMLAAAYDGRGPYAADGPMRNLRLIARIEDPTYLLVAVKRSSGITDLAQIREKRLPVRILAAGDSSAAVLAHYGLTAAALTSWGGSLGLAIAVPRDARFDVLISDLGSASNNIESAVWSASAQREDLLFLQLPEGLLKELARSPGVEVVTAPWGLLPGIDRPIATVGRSGEAIFGRADMPDQAAYDIAHAVDRNHGRLKWLVRPYSYDTATVFQDLDVPLHPGAARYYGERGYLR